jgi:hypothetical protein
MSTLLYTSLGWMDLEEQYVPGCVAAELPDAHAEASRAIAVAARTYVLRAMDEDPRLGTEAKPIPNHVRFQVFQQTAPSSIREATSATRSIVGRYQGQLVLCNHVIGAPWDKQGKPLLPDMTDTERWVTYNSGKTGAAVKPSPISNMTRPDNRGCMSARGADWLARQGYKYASILRYFYGADLYIAPIDVPPPLLGGPANVPQQPPVSPPGGLGNGSTVPAGLPATSPADEPSRGSFPLPLLALLAALLNEGSQG